MIKSSLHCNQLLLKTAGQQLKVHVKDHVTSRDSVHLLHHCLLLFIQASMFGWMSYKGTHSGSCMSSTTACLVGFSNSAFGFDNECDIAFSCCSNFLSYNCTHFLLKCPDRPIISFSWTPVCKGKKCLLHADCGCF